MTKTFRNVAAGLMTAWGVAGLGASARAGQADARTRARVRASSPAITASIKDAREQSSTFKRLVEAIEGSDGIVYVEEGEGCHGARACLLMTISMYGSHRILRILVDPARDGQDRIASIGHELRHAVEVLGDPHVTSGPAMILLYIHIGNTSTGRFETDAALAAGYAIRDELRGRRFH